MIPKTNYYFLLFFILICCFSATNTYAQCNEKFTDPGGLDNPYPSSADTTYTFCPDVAGDVVTVTFTFVDMEVSTTGTGVQGGCYDFLAIYSGSDTSAPLQSTACGELDGDGGTPSDPTSLLQAGDVFISNSADGCLTFVFTSDSSVQEEGWIADVTCGPPAACAAPVGLSANNITHDAADLSWASMENLFDIEWGATGFTPGAGTTVNGVSNPYTLSGLTALTTYDYYVCALCDDGSGGTTVSDCTGPQTFTTTIEPAACGGFFFDSGGPAGEYNSLASDTISICPDVAGDVVTITFTFVDLEAGGANGGCYDFLSIYSGSDTSTPLQQFACGELDGDGGTPSDATSLLQAGDFFTSTSPDGCLTVTFSSDGSVNEDGWAADVTCAPPADCPQPASLTVSNIDGSSAELSWASTETTFNIEWDTTGFTPGMGMLVNDIGNPYTLTGLMPETSYEYYVCAVCDDGAGGTIISTCTGPQTFTTDVACPVPTDLAVANETETSADLSWTSVENSFDIEWGEAGFASGSGTTVNDVSNPYTLSGLTSGTAYEYYVCAVCDEGMGGTINSECTGPFTFATAVPAPTCASGFFFDNGGPATAYAANSSDSLTICPDVAGDVVTVTFTFVDIETTTGTGTQDGCWDFLSIYNGSGTADTLQMTACGELDGDGGTPSVPESLLQASDFFTSTAADGCLTFTFSSDGSAQESGWEATITCAPPSNCAQPSSLTASNIGGNSADLSWTSDETVFDIEWGTTGFTPGNGTVINGVGNPHTLMGLGADTAYDYYVCAVCDDGMGGTITSACTGPFTFTTAVVPPTCSNGLFLDNGGSMSMYASSSSDSIVICPDMMGDIVTVTFTFVDIETGGSNGGCWDFLSIYDGSGTVDTLQAFACGELDGDGSTPADATSLLQAGDSFTSTAADGCLTFTFNSDGSVQEEGWEATVTCAPSTGGGSGCTDPCATNYDPAATMDDGSCTLPTCDDSCDLTVDSLDPTTCECVNTAPDPDDGCPLTDDSFDAAICMIVNTPPDPNDGCDLTADSFDAANCVIVNTAPDSSDGCDLTADSFDAANCVIVNTAPDPDDGCDLTADSFDATNCIIINTSNCPADTTFDAANCACTADPIPGCTDATACNYNANASTDDSSCVFATGCDTCAADGTVIDNPEVGDACDDGNPNTIGDIIQADCSCLGGGGPFGCTDPTACNYIPDALEDDGSCIYATGCDICDGNGGIIDNPEPGDPCDDGDPNTNSTIQADCSCYSPAPVGCTDATACNYDANAVLDDGSCVFATGCDTCAANGDVMDNPEVGEPCNDGDDSTENDTIQSDCTCAGIPIAGLGCTDATACNYDPMATTDDGSCTVSGDSCNDENPFTVNDTLQADCTCEGTDLGDGVPTVSEWGLIILALILLNLGVLYIRQTEMRIEKT